MKIDSTLMEIEKAIAQFKPTTSVEHVGHIMSLSDGVARIEGLEKAASAELLEFPHKIFGLALNLEEDSVGAIILGDYTKLHEGDTVKTTGRLLSIPAGEEILGRVVDPLGQPIDRKG